MLTQRVGGEVVIRDGEHEIMAPGPELTPLGERGLSAI